MIQKKSKNTIICFSLIFIITLSFLVPCFRVSAYSIVSLPDMENLHVIPESNLSQEQVLSIYSALVSNPNISQVGADSSDLLVFCWKYSNTNQISIYICSRKYCISCDYARVFSSSNSHAVGAWITTTLSDSYAGLETMNFTVQSVDLSTNNSFSCIIMNTAYNNVFMQATCYFSMNFTGNPDYSKLYSYVYNYSLPFNPDGVHSFTGLNLDFNETDFYNWLVDNDKVEISVDSGGASVGGKIPAYIGLQKLKSFISFYRQYGGSNTSFFKFIKGWFSYMNIANQTGDNINVLKTTMDNLYREYLNSYIVHGYSNTLNHAHQRKNIQTNTDDSDTTLITDNPNDSTDTSILRDILRGIISLSTSITSHFEALFDKLNELVFTVNVSNNGGANFTSADIWGSGVITDSENYHALTAAFMDKGIDVVSAESMDINYLDNATQQDSFTVSVDMPDQFVNGEFTSKTVTHTIDNTSKMYNTLLLFRKLIAFAVITYFAIRLRYELPSLIRGE